MKNLVFWMMIVVFVLFVMDVVEVQCKKNKNICNENILFVWMLMIEFGDFDLIDLMGVIGILIEIGEIIDSCCEIEEIGCNVEDSQFKLVMMFDSVVEFVCDKIGDLFFDMGFKVVKLDVEFCFEGELCKFYCEEDNIYEVEMVMVMKLVDGFGNVIWELLIIGLLMCWGCFYKDENYYELFVDLFIEVMYCIVLLVDFCCVFKKQCVVYGEL